MDRKIELILNEIKNESNEENLVLKLSEILEKVYFLFSKIRNCTMLYQADCYFILLSNIQSVLAYLAFVKDVPLNQELQKIVRDCERLDDERVRKFIFDEIKANRYSLENDLFLWFPPIK